MKTLIKYTVAIIVSGVVIAALVIASDIFLPFN